MDQVLLCNALNVLIFIDYYSLEAKEKEPLQLQKDLELENLPLIIATTFSEDVEIRIHLVDFINHYLVESEYVKTILTGYDLLKMLGKFYFYYKKKKEQKLQQQQQREGKPEPDDSGLSTMYLSKLSFEELEKEEWFEDDLNISRSFEKIPEGLWGERQRILSILSDLSTRYLQKDNYPLYLRFRQWYDWVNEIMEQPLDLPQESPDEELLDDWIAINPTDSHEELEEKSRTPLWSQRERLMSITKDKIRRLVKLDQPEVWKSRIRYAHLFGLLMGLSPDILIAVAAIEGILLLTSLIEKSTAMKNPDSLQPVNINVSDYIISLNTEHKPLPKHSFDIKQE